MKFQTAYAKHPRIQTTNEEPSLTQQSFKDECDLNILLKRYKKTGVLNHVRMHEGDYANLIEIDYHSALNQINTAKESFDSLPSEIRRDFNESPAEFIAFVSNPENEDQMREYGLLQTFEVPTVNINNLGELVQEASPPAADTPAAEG